MAINLSVLIVDDMETTRELLVHTLDILGVRDIRTSKNGREALEMLEDGETDLVISDLHMPYVDGMELYRRMKNDDRMRGVQFVLLTSDTTLATLPDGYRLGGHRMLRKPYTPQTILTCLKLAVLRKAGVADVDERRRA